MIKPAFLPLFAVSLAALAQPAPKLTSISPQWIQRGTTVEATLAGENLGGVTQFIFDGEPGLSATNLPPPEMPKPAVTIESTGGGITRADPRPPRDAKRLVVKVTAGIEASLSPRELRVIAPGGVSNPLELNVGQWPEVAKRGPNATIQEAQPIDLPAVISGVLNAAAETNMFRFKAAKGQDLVFEVDAARKGSPLDSSLTLVDPNGRELARNEDALNLDSLLFFTMPDDGDYILQLRDYRFRGGNDYFYRLYAGPIPYVESIFPFGGQRGKTVQIALAGHNLAGTTAMTLNIDAKAPRGRQEIRAKTSLFPFDVSDLTEIIEAEPNDAVTNAQVVTVPLVINGRIGTPKDVDRFRFKSGTDQKLVCEVAASRLGSKLDALLILSDTNSAVLQQNDDANGPDARLELDAKKGAEYLLALRDLTDRGGDRFGYRLSIRPPSGAAVAGFLARFLPDTPRVARDGTAKVRCEVTRNGGFEGPVRFTLAEAPTGVFAEPLVVPNSPSSGILLISATKDAPLGSFPLKLTASGVIGGKTVSVRAEPLIGDKPVRRAYLTVLETAPFRVDLATLSATLEQGQSTTIDVLAERREGFAGDLKLVAEGFEAGRDPLSKSFDGGEAVIKGGETLGKMTLKPKMDSQIGTRTIVVRCEATVDGQLVTQYTQPMPISVTQYPLIVSSTLSRLSVTALPPSSMSAASEAETKIKVDRRAGFEGDVELAIEGLPAGIKSELAKIPAGAAETTLKLVATDKAPVGTNLTLTVVATAAFNDRTYKTRTAPVTLTISAPEPLQLATNAPPATATPPGSK
ncbi:MAG: hypothetical protein DME25_19615 [Verrucomicrobia bacterium]|nr:MAG: hypothetical protein DME25_19615 [Verrucomicrobiota bacterium]